MGQVSSLNLVSLHQKLVWNSPKTSSGESGVQKVMMKVHQLNEIAVLYLQQGNGFPIAILVVFHDTSQYQSVYITEAKY